MNNKTSVSELTFLPDTLPANIRIVATRQKSRQSEMESVTSAACQMTSGSRPPWSGSHQKLAGYVEGPEGDGVCKLNCSGLKWR